MWELAANESPYDEFDETTNPKALIYEANLRPTIPVGTPAAYTGSIPPKGGAIGARVFFFKFCIRFCLKILVFVCD